MKPNFFLAVIFGIVLAFVMIAAMFIMGQTFGQRCANAGHKPNSLEWNTCVHDLVSK